MTEVNKFSACRRCGKKVKGDKTNCPECGGKMAFEVHINDTIHIRDSFSWEQIRKYYKERPGLKKFINVIGAASIILGFFLDPIWGSSIGAIVWVASFILTPYAGPKIVEIRSSTSTK